MSESIVGYTFNADTYCPSHIADVLPTGPGEAYDGWSLLIPASAEENLTEIAIAFGIDRDDEHSFDSGEFPKTITREQAENEPSECGTCGVDLVEPLCSV